VGAENIFVFDVDSKKLKAFADETDVNIADAEYIVTNCDYIFLGVKPQMLKNLFEKIAPVIGERTTDFTLVSMAAGVAVSDIKRISGRGSVIRIMPNMPVSVGSGVVLATADGVSDEDKAIFEKSMSQAGLFDWIDEKFIDAASALSGCGPAFAYMFAQALSDGAVACGLPRDKAILYAAGTLKGSAEMILHSDKHPEKLKDDVCSPGGSTIMGVKALEDEGMRGAAISAVIAAYNRTKELGK
jgi:pyrroline-5-carboxylate reductase